jgi:hypothetical protein
MSGWIDPSHLLLGEVVKKMRKEVGVFVVSFVSRIIDQSRMISSL